MFDGQDNFSNTVFVRIACFNVIFHVSKYEGNVRLFTEVMTPFISASYLVKFKLHLLVKQFTTKRQKL